MICPYCEAEIPGVTPQRRPPARRAPARARAGGDRAAARRTGALYGETAARPGRSSGTRRSHDRSRPASSTGARASTLDRRRCSLLDDLEGEPMDRTLILVKPDAFARGMTGEIIARFERKGLEARALKQHDLAARPPRSTTPSTPSARSSASSSTSSPAARSSRWCSRGTRPSSAARQVDRRDESAGGRARLDPRRLRARGRQEHGPRLGLERVRGARGRVCSSRSSRSQPALRERSSRLDR